MSKRYPGGFIFRSNPTIVGPTGSPPEGGSAPGVWTLEQASYYTKQGIWPQRIIPRGLYSWGQSISGELGLNANVNVSSPTQIGSLTDWSSISGGQWVTGAVKNTGSLWAWGNNSDGQLGQNNRVYRSSPVQVGALTNWSSVSMGVNYGLSTKTDGTLWSWGQNSYGQLGQSDKVNRSSPVQIGSDTTWSKVSTNNISSFAIKTDGTLWSWGSNSGGELGQNDRVYRSSPVQIGALTNWASVSPISDTIAAIKTDGTLWTWGGNDYGQLGLNISYTSRRSSPVQVGALTNWSKVSRGGGVGGTNFIAVKTDGTLWAWGRNLRGELGLNSSGAYAVRSSPVQVGALTNWSTVASGANVSLATKTDGTLWTWGKNDSGQLGTSNVIYRSSPVQVGALTTWLSVSAGNGSSLAISS